MTPTKHQQNWLPGIFNDFFGNEWIAKTNSAAPAINIVETEKEYEVEIAAPGITKDDFEITVDKDNHLVVTVERKQEDDEKDKKGRYLRREFSYSQFQQTLILPDNVDTDAIEACQNNGVLTVKIPKKKLPTVSEKKKIAVK
ncbi:Hsp20/alpha crystallin family protein [Barnesiella viscericola]|uniref:Heat-shock protein n=2 Tax=Barnesiella viscericola TaxID=397865 RepID=W0ESE4_9BACT|nr:Hsp20/alpha crystallin family protein [Barnesiella viscericola]AHF12046.1 heat-shock protein [Barnesiella viscericola DSM 18177]HJG89108.1 Hsp20/alpha crystallin family protein [Barnesiella viscericola]